MTASRPLLIVLLFTVVITSTACGVDSTLDSSPDSSPSSAAGSSNTASSSDATVGALKVIQSSTLSIAVADVLGAYSRVVDSTRSAGGYVSRADIRDQDGKPFASVQLRVPSSRHEELLTSITSLPGARVDNQSITSKEISGEYTDLESHIRNLERTEAQYQQFLTQVRTIDEVLNVSNRLQATRDEIERNRGRLDLYDNQVEFSAVDLQIATLVPATTAAPLTPVRVLETGWEASKDLLRLSLTALMASLFVVAWLLPVGAALVLGLRLYRRCAPAVLRLLK